MEKKDKREFTDEEVLMATRCCAKEVGACASGCPLRGHFACTKVKVRLADMYEEKCKELEEWKKSHAICIEDITERGDREVHLESLVRSYQDQYIKIREECDGLHKEINENIFLNMALRNSEAELVSQNDKLREENRDLAAQVNSLSDKLAELENENKKLKEENEELLTANKHLIQVRDEYREAMPKLTEANNKLRNKLATSNKNLKMMCDWSSTLMEDFYGK